MRATIRPTERRCEPSGGSNERAGVRRSTDPRLIFYDKIGLLATLPLFWPWAIGLLDLLENITMYTCIKLTIFYFIFFIRIVLEEI